MSHPRFAGRRLSTAIALAAAAYGLQGFTMPTSANAFELEEITVTARKREESLQDVAASVSALSQTDLQRRFDSDVRDFVTAAPNVILDDIQQGPGSPAAMFVRGIGVADIEKSFDPTVGVVIDGLFIGVNSGAYLKSIDLARVEVLRGPQGTVFGRNAIAGVINLERTAPTHELSGRVRASYGNFQSYELDAYVSFGLGEVFPTFGDKVAMKFTGSLRSRDGYLDNLTTGITNGDTQFKAIGYNLLIEPTDNIDIEFTYELTEQDQHANTVLNFAQPTQLLCSVFGQCAQGFEPQSGDVYDVLQNRDPSGAFFNTDMYIVELGWDFMDNLRLDYIWGRFTTDEEVGQDWDGSPITFFHTDRPAVYEQTSHELRLTGSFGDRFSFVAGGYLYESAYRIDLLSFIGFVVPDVVLEIPQVAEQTTDSWAFFFEADYDVTDRLTLTLGGRYTNDEKTGALDDPAIISNLDDPFEESWSEFTPKAAISYDVMDNAMVYGLYSRGFRAGGFLGRPGTLEAAAAPYDPETVDNFEIGIKSEWFDNTVLFNASAFYMNYKDKQEEVQVPLEGSTGQQTLVLNAAAVKIKGIEIETQWFVRDNWQIRANFGWLDAEYDDFEADITGDGIVTDNTGLEPRRAPTINFNISTVYEQQLTNDILAYLTLDYRYLGEHEVSAINTPWTSVDQQNLVTASINFTYRDNTTISFFGRNILEEDELQHAFDVGGENGLWTYGAAREPRTYGVQITQTF